MREERAVDGLGRWTRFEKWTVGFAIAFVIFAILGGNTGEQWTGLIWALGSLGLLAWFFSIPIALLILGMKLWQYLRARGHRSNP